MTRVTKMICEFIILLGAGCLLLVLVQFLPADRIRYHIEESALRLAEEGDYPYVGSCEQAFLVDNWTEATLLTFNYTSDTSRPIYSAFIATSYMPPNSTGVSRLQAVISENWREKEDYISTRGVNWIGYNVFLRLGLCFLNMAELRVILNIVSYSVVFLTLLMIYRYQGGYKAFGIGITLLLFNFYTLSVCWSLGVFCVLVACIVIMFFLNRSANLDYFNAMFVVGIITAYFDWLSIPLITWGLPIGIILAKEYQERNSDRFKPYFMLLLKTGAGWCLGYILMTLSKTAIAVGIQGKEAWDFFTERLAADTNTQSLKQFCIAVYKLILSISPFNVFPEESVVPAMIVGVAFLLQIVVVVRYRKMRAMNLAYMLVGFAPFVYYVYAKGHIGHVAIEFRSLMISCYALWLSWEPIYCEIVKNNIRKRNA
ncbi:MAG: hypothetical protein NC121_04435 [Blautia sp.]|nr:hypothetical protein [Blautia sp.]